MARWRQTLFRYTELLLLTVGVLCIAYLLLNHHKSILAARAAQTITPHASAKADSSSTRTIKVDPNPAHARVADVMGRLEIPQIGLSVPIMSNYASESLREGIGYIPGTALPGGLGTLGLAGHRDTYFRPLRRIRQNMDIRVADHTGVYHYEVDSTEIVKPDQVRVLDIQDRPELTLITCYPFNYIGAAPLRFIVHAHLLSALPDGS